MSGAAQPAAAELRGQQPRAASRLDFLEAVFAGAEVGQVAFWRLSDRRARWLPVQRLDEAAEIPTTTDFYLTVALHDQELALRLAGQRYHTGALTSWLYLLGSVSDSNRTGLGWTLRVAGATLSARANSTPPLLEIIAISARPSRRS